MEQYQKPVMEITELERIDVLTKSKTAPCPVCGGDKKYGRLYWTKHMTINHADYIALNPDYKDIFDETATFEETES